MNCYLFGLIFLIISYIILAYFVYKSNISIIQSGIYEFDIDTLMKKQPIIIHDKVVNIEHILASWFSVCNFVRNTSIEDNNWVLNNFKYMIAQPMEDTNIFLKHPSKKMNELLEIKISANQILIIPFHWSVFANTSNIKTIGIHDIVTYILNPGKNIYTH